MGGREVASCPAPAPLTGHITTFSCNFHIDIQYNIWERFNNLNYCKDLYKSWYQVAGAVSKYCVSWYMSKWKKLYWQEKMRETWWCSSSLLLQWLGRNGGKHGRTTAHYTTTHSQGCWGQARWREDAWSRSRESWLHQVQGNDDGSYNLSLTELCRSWGCGAWAWQQTKAWLAGTDSQTAASLITRLCAQHAFTHGSIAATNNFHLQDWHQITEERTCQYCL